MEKIFANIRNAVSQEVLFILLGILVLIIILLFILRALRLSYAKRELTRLEDKFDVIKGLPLAFKINKAVALARVNPTLNEHVFEAQQTYDSVNEEIRRSTLLLADMDDLLYSKKHRQVLLKAEELEKQLNKLEVDVTNVDKMLDEVLRQESEQRDQINRLKEKFRLLKQQIGIDRTKYDQGNEYINKEISNIEKMFSLFEEWMFASEFEKAAVQHDEITVSLEKFSDFINVVPISFEIINTRLQKQMDAISYAYASYKNEGIYLQHLGIKDNLELVSSVVKESISKITKGITTGIQDELNGCDVRLAQLSDQLVKEHESFEEVKELAPIVAKRCDELLETTKSMNDLYEQYHVRFSLENYDVQMEEFKNTIDDIQNRKKELMNKEVLDRPATEYLVDLKKLQEACEEYDLQINRVKNLLQTVLQDERRAKQQLTKLNLILHEIGIKMSKSRVAHVEESYEDDMRRAKVMLTELNKLLNASIVNIKELNFKIKESIDYIYTLYNTVNNFVGTAIMVENMVVFGNRYRSTHADLDSQLTRSELYYRNGEYAKALQIAVVAIEKIVPGIYEKMLQGSDKKEMRLEL